MPQIVPVLMIPTCAGMMFWFAGMAHSYSCWFAGMARSYGCWFAGMARSYGCFSFVRE